MTIRHFGVLIPSTNTTVEIECRLLPPAYPAHFGRLMSSGGSFSPSRDEDIDYQSRLLGTAKVELIILAQTSASLFADDYDDVVTKRMRAGAGAPAITSAQAVGRAVRALGARRIAIVSPYSVPVNERAARYFQTRHRLETIALEGFGATDAYAIGQLGPQNAHDAFARIDRGTTADRVFVGNQVSTFTALVASALPAGASVLAAEEDFTSVLFSSSTLGAPPSRCYSRRRGRVRAGSVSPADLDARRTRGAMRSGIRMGGRTWPATRTSRSGWTARSWIPRTRRSACSR